MPFPKSQIEDHYQSIQETLKKYSNAKLVAVSKKQNLEKLKILYDCGHRLFGENYLQEWQDKKSTLSDDIEWHFIGSLQSRKVKSLILDGISCIHSLGSESCLKKYAQSEQKPPFGAFIQVNIAGEEQKAGLSPEAVRQYCNEDNLTFINGLMTMPPAGLEEKELRFHFKTLKSLAEELNLKEVSMGMSSDWKIALEEGATLIRIGSSLFGPRDY